MIFDFLNDIGNYESRKVMREDLPEGFVSTCFVSDGKQPFETAISHKEWDNGKLVIVQAYDTMEEAALAHLEWVEKFKNKDFPDEIFDCKNALLTQLDDDFKPSVKRVKS